MNEKVGLKGRAYIPLFFLMLIIIFSVIVGYIAIERRDKSFTRTSSAMGVQICQMLYGNDAETAANKVKEKVEELEDLLSYDIDGSDIDRINVGSGEKWIKASEETVNILDKFISISKKSKGTIDPTSLPLISAWGFDSGTAKCPDNNQIKTALDKIDYRDIKINYDVSRIKIDNKDGAITLRHVEKGAACSAAIDIYKGLKVDYGVIGVGGVVGVYGTKPDNSLWKISVKDPFLQNGEDARIAVVKIRSGYVATFGIKQDKININGTQKNKILDIRTGYPVENNVALVSVLHPDAVVANVLSQVCCILDKDLSQDVLNYYGAEAVFVYNDKKIYITPKIKDNFIIIDSAYTLID